MASKKPLPGKMDSIDVFYLRKEWDDLEKATEADDESRDALEAKAKFVNEIWPMMPEILDILDGHFNGPDGMAQK